MKKIILVIITNILLCPIIWAQKKMDRSQELKIGQVLPNIPFQSVLNYKHNKIDIKSYQDKVVILDFFDTYCTNCIAAMPKLQKLQDEMGDKLQIILVTWQDKETIEEFYRTNDFLKENQVRLPTICDATLLQSFFPHTGVPHTGWIFKNIVQAITYSDFIKSKHIEELYTRGSIQLPVKSDFNDGLNNVQNGINVVNEIGSVLISGYKDAVGTNGVKFQYDSIANFHKTTFYNMDVLGAYTSAWSKIRKPKYLLNDQRVVWKVKDLAKYKYPQDDEGALEWLSKNGICYERSDKIGRSKPEQAQIILNDLNSFFGLSVYWSTKKVNCLVLQRIRGKAIVKPSDTSGGALVGTEVLAFMIDYRDQFPPVVDEVNSDTKIHIDDYSSVHQLNLQLADYGWILQEEVREIEVLVFEEI